MGGPSHHNLHGPPRHRQSYTNEGDRSHSRSILDKLSGNDCNMSAIIEEQEGIEISDGEDGEEAKQSGRNLSKNY